MNPQTTKKFGTAPVFFTAISTILGAILFLRFGYAVGTLGFWGVILIIILGHTVTIPTAFAISEIATNKRVEGGGEYYIISRSFGLNIGATIGMALFLSQAISVAFYVIAFTEAFDFFFVWVKDTYDIILPRQAVSIPVMLLLASLILTKGANLGVKALYFVVAILFIALILFFAGKPEYSGAANYSVFSDKLRNQNDFFKVFAIIFPAFTGMTAGVGLSGDLKKPGRSIPIGTTLGTITGMIIYFFIAYKLAVSASVDDLMNDQFVMGKIAIAGYIVVPLGLAASTISSALGSVMVAPRTLQAISADESFPILKMNKWLSKSRAKDNEPFNASLITILIAMIFVAIGNINAVAEVISMFFMVTYGSLCLISFLNNFGSSPSYRPSFKSHWILSIIGFVISIWVMFKINMPYAVAAIVLMFALYFYVDNIHKNRKGLATIFANTIFQLNRKLQLYLQKEKTYNKSFEDWRPSAICISSSSFERITAFKLLNWISYKYGFGTYLHKINGYYSKNTVKESKDIQKKLLNNLADKKSNVFVDTIISPSNTSAIAQAIQMPGIAGLENNMIIFEYHKENPVELPGIIDNFNLVSSGNFDVCILADSTKPMFYKNGIDVWIKSNDSANANLMIMLSFIILGHPDWAKGNIKIYDICTKDKVSETQELMKELVETGRLPISEENIQIIIQEDNVSPKTLINQKSIDAGLTIIGFREETLNHEKIKYFEGYDSLGTILFVNSSNIKKIE